MRVHLNGNGSKYPNIVDHMRWMPKIITIAVITNEIDSLATTINVFVSKGLKIASALIATKLAQRIPFNANGDIISYQESGLVNILLLGIIVTNKELAMPIKHAITP